MNKDTSDTTSFGYPDYFINTSLLSVTHQDEFEPAGNRETSAG
jgi:hypothetical protein